MGCEKGVVAQGIPAGWAADMIPHLKALGVKRVQVLIYENVQDQVPDLLAIQEAIPDIAFTVRIYAANIITFNPASWARECRRRLDVLLGAGLNVTALIPANEFNVEVPEDRPELATDWAHQVGWLQEFANTWHFLPGASVDLDVPALSPQPGWTAGLDAYRAGGLDLLYQRKDAHCYPGSELAYQEVIDRWPLCRTVISEFNRIDPESYIASLPPAVEEADWFILHWISPTPGAPDVDLIGSPYYDSFARAGKEEDMTQGRIQLWDQLTQPWEVYPALTKAIVGRGGQPVGVEYAPGDGYTYQLGVIPSGDGMSAVSAVAYAKTGDWENISVAKSPAELPLP